MHRHLAAAALFALSTLHALTESVSAVAAKLVGTWSLKFSYTIKNNSDVTPGLENTDSFTAVGVEYTF